ncbi:MAG: hypothetical protein A2Z74_01230 [Chloroflexi bacterium RBG_13_46_9]|nr:MAG: hypothetical protein A2Z74_01230 [Chloroflexi bacterium RBG_13_46_9]
MTRKEKIEQEVQKTFESFDQVERLKSNPFFYARLKTRIDDLYSKKKKIRGWEFARRVLKPALLLLIIALNIFSATLFFKYRTQDYTNREQLLDFWGQELILNSNQCNPNFLMNE